MMRTRAHRSRMLKRVLRSELTVTIPEHVLLSNVDEIQAWIRGQTTRLCVPPGGHVVVRILDRFERSPKLHLKVAPRRDTNSPAVARWLPDPAERTPR